MQLATCTALETRGKAFPMLLDATGNDAGCKPTVLTIENGQHNANADQRQGRHKDQISGQDSSGHISV
jgi:hypothetical protein